MGKTQTVHRLELVPPPQRGSKRPNSQRQVVDVTIQTSDRLLLTVEDAAERLSISRAQMWRLISSGQVASIHVGRLRRVQPEALADYIARIGGGDFASTGDRDRHFPG